jgi:4-hydroxy-tetrahydrodipicolinate synthase
VAITVAEAGGKIPVLAGAGGNNTAEVVTLAKRMAGLGANGILSVAPYYNKPSQEGIYRHFKAIAEAVSLPVIVYSIQGRTGVNVEPPTLERLAHIENIVGVKEASGNINQIGTIIARVPERFTVLSGDDALALPVIALGGRGVISVVSNQIPAEMTRLIRCCLDNDFVSARKLQRTYLPLMEANFLESNPIPVKAAMAEMGLLEPVWRLPLCPPRAETLQRIKDIIESLGLLGDRHVTRAN